MLEYCWLFALLLRSARCFTGVEGKWTLLPPISPPSSPRVLHLLFMNCTNLISDEFGQWEEAQEYRTSHLWPGCLGARPKEPQWVCTPISGLGPTPETPAGRPHLKSQVGAHLEQRLAAPPTGPKQQTGAPQDSVPKRPRLPARLKPKGDGLADQQPGCL